MPRRFAVACTLASCTALMPYTAVATGTAVPPPSLPVNTGVKQLPHSYRLFQSRIACDCIWHRPVRIRSAHSADDALFSAKPGNPKALRILLLGGIHGDEQTSSAITFKWMEKLLRNGPGEFQWKVAPVVNPDGLLARPATRVNANGVDLNRNFPTPEWQKEAEDYWVRTTKRDPRRFPGKQPVSEPESRWVNEEIERYKPHVIISVHAPYGVLDFDGPAEPPVRFGRLIYNRVGVYPGSLGNYSGLHKDIPVVTIELPNARQMPSDDEINRIWDDMQQWIRKNLSKASVKD
jgi:hypothetical protein